MIATCTNFFELGLFLQTFCDGPVTSQSLVALHDQVEQTYRQAAHASVLDGHPGWHICSGQKAAEIFLCRNWLRGSGKKKELSRLKQLAEQMQQDFQLSACEKIDMDHTEALLRHLECKDHFVSKVMGNEQLSILIAGCRHR